MPVLLLLILLAGGPVLSAAERATPHGAFVIASPGITPRDLGRMIEGSEEVFFRLTRYPDNQYPPVRILLGEKEAHPFLKVDALENGSPSISLTIPRDPGCSETPPLLTAALLLREYYGKTAPVPGSGVPQYPGWVLHGLGQLMTGGEDHGSVLSPEETAGEAPLEIAAFLTQRIPEPETVALLQRYDIMAAELVRAGLSDDSGRAAFREWVGSYDASQPNRAQSKWVEGWQMQGVERRWVLGLHVARRGQDPLSVTVHGTAETLNAYGKLMAEFWPQNGSLADLRKERGGPFRLNELSRNMVALRLQSSPLVSPLIDETIIVIREAPRLDPAKLRKKEESLRAQADAIRARDRAITDYMNWYEAARLEKRSGLYDKYLETPETPVTKGPVGRFLDAVEQRGW